MCAKVSVNGSSPATLRAVPAIQPARQNAVGGAAQPSGAPSRKILAYLAETELSAGDIASRFEMTKPSLSKHLKILESAGLVVGEKRGQFVFYRLQRDNLAGTLSSFMQAVCPVSHGLKRESKQLAAARKRSAG